MKTRTHFTHRLDMWDDTLPAQRFTRIWRAVSLRLAKLIWRAERGPTVSRTISVNPDERGGFVAVVIAVLTGFGSEAKGTRFGPNEAVPRVAA